jgi:hypothetical protein
MIRWGHGWRHTDRLRSVRTLVLGGSVISRSEEWLAAGQGWRLVSVRDVAGAALILGLSVVVGDMRVRLAVP